MNCLISYTTIVCTVFCLEYSSCTWYIIVLTVLRVSSYYKFLWAMWTFHSKFIYFSRMKIINPSFYWIESYSLSYHVFAAFTTNMKWRLISNFATSNSLTLNDFKWFILCKLTLFRRYLVRVIVFGIIEIICSGCSKCTHKYKKL